MTIKQPWLAVLSVFLLLVAAVFALERLVFLAGAERTSGTVTNVTSWNARCGGKKKYDCTKFEALVGFVSKDGTGRSLTLSAGDTQGHGRPVAAARLRTGERVPVVYDPEQPSKAYEDTLWGVWSTPIMTLAFQVISFFSSLMEPKRKRW